MLTEHPVVILMDMDPPALDGWVDTHALGLGLGLIVLTSGVLLVLARRAASIPRTQG